MDGDAGVNVMTILAMRYLGLKIDNKKQTKVLILKGFTLMIPVKRE